MTSTLGRIDFAAQRKIAIVEVPELGGSFRLRALSVSQLHSLSDGDTTNTAKMLALAIVDGDNQRIYTTDEDIANLSEMSVSVMKILTEAAGKLNGVDPETVKETIKNSEAGPSTDSASS